MAAGTQSKQPGNSTSGLRGLHSEQRAGIPNEAQWVVLRYLSTPSLTVLRMFRIKDEEI